MRLETFSPALTLLFVAVMMCMMMDIHYAALTKLQKWLAPLIVLALMVMNHLLHVYHGVYAERYMWLTMHLPFFLLFLWLTRCGVIKMAFMILSAFTFTAPTIVLSNFVMMLLPDDRWALLASNLISYLAILALVQFVFRRGFNYIVKYGSNRLFLQFSVVPFVYYIYVFAALNADFSSLVTPLTPGNLLVRYFPSLEVFVFYFLLLEVYRSLSERKEMETTQTALTQQLRSAEEQMTLLNQSQTQTAVYQHDMRHHLNMLDGLLSSGKPDQAEEYIQKVQADIESITPRRFCENELVNLLSSSFTAKARKAGITLTVEAKLPNALAISDTELCSLLSNALENALRAVSELPEGQRHVSLYCGVRQNKLLIEVRNPYAGTVYMKNGVPASVRGEGHGYGCRSIQTIAQRNGGLCVFTVQDKEFCMQAMLPVLER